MRCDSSLCARHYDILEPILVEGGRSETEPRGEESRTTIKTRTKTRSRAEKKKNEKPQKQNKKNISQVVIKRNGNKSEV